MPTKFFLCISRWITSFWEVSNFFANLRKNAKIRKVVKYKVYEKLEFQKRLQLIHDVWTVNISMKIELWDFCKLFCTNISFWHTTRFTFMCVTSFSLKMNKYFINWYAYKKFSLHFLMNYIILRSLNFFCKFAKKMQKFAKS